MRRRVRYLAEHHLEEVIADAIREVIHETLGLQLGFPHVLANAFMPRRPNDPHAFLSAQILKHAKGGQAAAFHANLESGLEDLCVPMVVA